MPEAQQIEGLPPGAIVKPIAKPKIEGLPEGAIVRPITQDSTPRVDEPKPSDWRDRVMSHLEGPEALLDARTAKDLGLPANASKAEIVAAQKKNPVAATKVGSAVNRATADVVGAVLHPVDTVKSALQQAEDIVNQPLPIPGVTIDAKTGEAKDPSQRASQERVGEQGRQFIKEVKEDPYAAAGDVVGQAVLGEIGGKVAGKIGEIVPERARLAAQRAVGASKEKVAAEAAKTADKAQSEYERVRAQNQKAEEQTHMARGKVDEAYEKKLREAADAAKEAKEKHTQAVKEVREHNERVRMETDRRNAMKYGMNKVGKKYGEEINGLEKNTRIQANKNYTDLKTDLKDASTRGNSLGRTIDEAEGKIQGTDTQPTILKELRSRFVDNDLLSYNDLQGYYSEMGKMLQGGNLPGDVYQSIKTLQNGVSTLMEDMAKRTDAENLADGKPTNIAERMTQARNYYRNFMQDFHEPTGPSGSGSPLAQSVRAVDAAKVLDPFLGDAGDRGVATIAKYDPELARRVNSTRKLHEQMKTSAVPKEKPMPAAPKAEVVEKPEYEQPKAVEAFASPTIDPVEIRKNLIEKTKDKWANVSASDARSLAGSAIGGVVAGLTHGNPITGAVVGNIVSQGMRRLATVAASNPAVVEWLTRPNAADIRAIEKIPGIDKTNVKNGLTKIAIESAKQGKPIKLSPSVAALIGSDNLRLVKMAETAAQNKEDYGADTDQ